MLFILAATFCSVNAEYENVNTKLNFLKFPYLYDFLKFPYLFSIYENHS